MAQRFSVLDRLTFGGRVPGAVGLLMALTIVVSLGAAVGSRWGLPVGLLTLVPERVWSGEVWRLATWMFVEGSPFGLVFAVLLLFWFGRDLATAWGPRRFLLIYAVLAGVTGAVACLLGWLDPAVMVHPYDGNSPLAAALVVAWGLVFPTRQINLWMILPITGRMMVYGTIGLTIAYAAYSGWETVLLHLVAEGLMLAYLFRRRIATQLRGATAGVKGKGAGERRGRTGRAGRGPLSVVRDDDEPGRGDDPKKWIN